jgi:SpoVK/Ycf46/Vps4 family AAA+-type ATPase
MENFKGILICATNFPDGLDTASLRRFNLRLHFHSLDSSGNLVFYKRILADMVDQSLTYPYEVKIRNLKGLVPGDFKVAWQRNVFLDRSNIGHGALIQSLEDSCRDRKGEIKAGMGFV